MSKKYISFSLFGSSRLYCDGLISNIELAKTIYSDFKIITFISSNCPLIPILQEYYPECELRIMPPHEGINREDEKWVWSQNHLAMFYRMYILDELEEDDVVLFRDCDSRVSERESKIVYEWMKSPYACLVFAENEAHRNSFFMSGMASIKTKLRGVKESIEKWIEHYKTLNHPWVFCDLEYNTRVLGPILAPSTIGFGYGFPNPLPELKEGERFIGDVYEPRLRNEIFSAEEWKENNRPKLFERLRSGLEECIEEEKMNDR